MYESSMYSKGTQTGVSSPLSKSDWPRFSLCFYHPYPLFNSDGGSIYNCALRSHRPRILRLDSDSINKLSVFVFVCFRTNLKDGPSREDRDQIYHPFIVSPLPVHQTLITLLAQTTSSRYCLGLVSKYGIQHLVKEIFYWHGLNYRECICCF